MKRFDFSSIEKLIFNQFDLIGINFQINKKTSKTSRISFMVAKFNILLVAILINQTFLVLHNLMDLIIHFQLSMLFYCGLFLYYTLQKHKSRIYGLIKWMKNNFEKKNPVTKKFKQRRFKNGVEYSLYLIKFAQGFCGLAFTLILGLGTILSIYMFNKDELVLPMNIYHGWLKPTTTLALILSLMQSVIAGGNVVSIYNAGLSFVYPFFYNLITQFNVLIDIVENIDQFKEEHGLDKWIKEVAETINDQRR